MSHHGWAVRVAAAAACLGVAAPPALGQVVVSGSTTYTQNFDSLAQSGTPTWTNNGTLGGWYAAQAAPSAPVTSYIADDGTGTAGGLRSYGVAGAHPVTDRALGSLTNNGSSAATLAYGVVFQNTGTAPLSLHIQHNGEWWRDGTASTPEILHFTYKSSTTQMEATNYDASSMTAAGFTTFTALDFNPAGLARSPSGPRDGNLDPKTMASDLTGVTLNPGEFVSLRWFDGNANGKDDGLALDDMTISFTVVPEPVMVLAVGAAGLALAALARRPWSARNDFAAER
jgi:hypothetical protein